MENKNDILDWRFISTFFLFDFKKLSNTQEEFFAVDFTERRVISGVKVDISTLDHLNKTNLLTFLKNLFSRNCSYFFNIIQILQSLNNLYLINEGLNSLNLELIIDNYRRNNVKFSLTEVCIQFIIKNILTAFNICYETYKIKAKLRCVNCILKDQYLDIKEDFNSKSFLRGGCNYANFNKHKSKYSQIN